MYIDVILLTASKKAEQQLFLFFKCMWATQWSSYYLLSSNIHKNHCR